MTKIYKPKEEYIYSKNFNYYFLLKYRRFKKILNLGLGILAQRNRTIKVKHFPYLIYIDPTNICPLKCPLCPTGIRKQGREKGIMKLSVCKDIIDNLKDYLFFVRLYNWGEPFLNLEIFKMIDYIHQNNIGTIISTNLNIVNDEIIEKIVNSPLDYLIVSIDGITQDIYEKYRVGGNLDRVMSNLRKIISLKERKKKKLLKIEWLYVVNQYNEKEMRKAEELAIKMGVDNIHFSPIMDSLSASKMDSSGENIYKSFKTSFNFSSSGSKTCSWLYSRIIFNWDGKVSPCCGLDNAAFDFGDINRDKIRDIWNNKYYQTARKIFKDNLKKEYPNFICSRCLFMKD